MARDDLHFRLRIPEDLKQKVEASARANGHSMTAEMIKRLNWTFNQSYYDAFGPSNDTPSSAVPQVYKWSEEDSLRHNLAIERALFEDANEWLEREPKNQKAQDAAEMSEVRIIQIERRLKLLDTNKRA